LKEGYRVIIEDYGEEEPATVLKVFKNGKVKVEFEDGDKETFPGDEVSPFPEEDQEEESEEEDDEEPKCVACGGSGKSSSGKKCRPCKGTGVGKQKPKEKEPKEDPKPKTKKGKDKSSGKTPECPAPDGSFGEVDQYDECDTCPHWNECESVSA